MDFAEVERRFYELKGRLAAGLITPAAFEAGARDLTLRDAAGRLWTIGAQTGKWYCAIGGSWVEAQPPTVSLVQPSSPAGGPPPAMFPQAATVPLPPVGESRRQTAGAGTGMSALSWLAAGFLGAMGILVAGGLVAALFLPASPWRLGAASPVSSPTVLAAQRTAEPVTTAAAGAGQATGTASPTVTPVVIVVTATPLPSTSTPIAPPAATMTPTPVPPLLVATATATQAPPPTPTLTLTPTPPVPTPTATAVPASPAPLSVTLSNPHYERWGRPTDSTGCLFYNNASPVRRFTTQIVLKNNTAATISDWKGPYFYANSGVSLARCYYPFNTSETTLPPVPANSANTVTFVTFTDEGTWVSRVEFVYRDRTWRWTLDANGQVIAGP